MHPYRDLPIEAPSTGKKRSKLKTIYWKLLLAVKGKWKRRYYRGCGDPECNRVHVQMDGGLLDFQSFWCQLEHQRERKENG